MYQKNNIFILSGMKVSDMILSNPYFILMLEHFGIELEVHEKTVEQICRENNIGLELFISFANLFNGFKPPAQSGFSFDDVMTIVNYLISSHKYYLEEKYPRIRSSIQKMFEVNDKAEVLLVDKFFNEYFSEVKEHLRFENEVVFPYVNYLHERLKSPDNHNGTSIAPSSAEYRARHNNIEEKLTDLKSLLIKYLPRNNDQQIRRELLFGLFELEYDLSIHSQIEDNILIPLMEQIERHLLQNK